MCGPGAEHKGQGLLLRLGSGEGTVVLTCHHVVAAMRREDLRVRAPLSDGTLGEPIEVVYDERRSRPEQDAAVLRAPDDAMPSESSMPLLHRLGPDTYEGNLMAAVLTHLIPDSFDAMVRPSTLISGRIAPGAGWLEAPERYHLRAFRLAEATYSEPGFSGGVVYCEGGVLGLAHFGRAEAPYRAREAYLVPLSAWAEGWFALEDLVEPLVDEKLRRSATVRRGTDLAAGIGKDVIVAGYRPELYAEREADERARRALDGLGGVIVVGRPLSGKSRLTVELLRKNPRAVVVIPKPHTLAPPERFEASGFADEDAILLFDDLHRMAETSQTLAWRQALEEATGHPCKVVCTSRDGADWRQVEIEQGRLLDDLGDGATVFTSRVEGPSRQDGEDLTGERGWELAEDLGMNAAEFERRFDGTPGSLLLDLADMRRRYEKLRDEHRGGVSMGRLLDSIKLLYKARLPAFPDALVRAVAERVRGTGPLDQETWETLLRRTREEGFVGLDDETRAITFYAPYLERCVLYEPPRRDFERLAQLVEASEDAIVLFFLVAFFGHDLKDYERALTLVERAIDLEPNSADSWYNKSFTLNRMGRNDEALEAIERAIHLDPEYHAAYYSKGWALMDSGRPVEALESFREALRRGGGFLPRVVSMYLDGLSAALAKLGRLYEGVYAGLQALSMYPPYPPSAGHLCNVLCAAGQPALALEVAKRALDADTEWMEAWYGKGVALDELGHDREALEAYTRTTGLQHDLPEIWARKGGILLRMHDRVRASDKLAKALNREDVDAIAEELASRALDAVDTAIDLGAGQVASGNIRALLLWRLDRHEEALESIEGALELEPTNPLMHHNRGIVLAQAQRYEEALEAFMMALSLDPNFLNSWWPAVLLLDGHFGRPAEALVAVNHLISFRPEALYLFARGCLLAKLGRPHEARFWIRHARKLGGALLLPGNPSGRQSSAVHLLGPHV